MRILRSKGRMTALQNSVIRDPFTSVKIHSLKRKKTTRSSSNSNPFTFVFTRSKSRIFHHQNRSGFTRPDPVTTKPLPAMKSVESFLDLNCRSASRVLLTKDLRHKRVFTPGVNSVIEGEEIEEKNQEHHRLFKGFISSTIPDVNDDPVRSEVGDERVDGACGLELKDQAIPGKGSLPKMNMALNVCQSQRRKVFKAPSSFNYRRLLPHMMDIVKDASDNELDRTAETIKPLEVKAKCHQNDASVEENIQTTPPDPGLLAKTEVSCGRESADTKKNQTFIEFPAGSEKNSSDTLKQSPNTKCSANLMNKTVLNPCSRLRLFRNPRSISYRRLLPFLMDIAKPDSCTRTKPQKKVPQVVSEEDRHPAPAATAEHDFVNNSPKVKICKKIFAEDIIQTASDSNNNLVSSIPELSATNYSSNADPRPVNSVTLPESGMVTEETPQSQSGLAKLQLDLRSKESNSVSEPSSAVSYIQTKQCTPGEPRPFKGILKRNRRGCRGLCNCLNCASFRLHAERAFEFSRNQLHDAEEVASQLMKELANVRLLLEKYLVEKDDSASIRPHPVLIEQACNKAIEAETLAKERLGELNNDLSIHCRIPDLLQPKVSFAHNSQ